MNNDDLGSVTVEAKQVNGSWCVIVRDGSDTSAQLTCGSEHEAMASATSLRFLLTRFRDRVIAEAGATRLRNVILKIQEQIEEVL